MSVQKESYLKKLVQTVPPGFFVDTKWLSRQGISRSLVATYQKNGWLLRRGHGLYQRPNTGSSAQTANTTLDWDTLILSMQTMMDQAVHVGGSTALTKHGHAHYVAMGQRERVFLYAAKFPGWLQSVETNAQFELRNRRLFKDPNLGLVEEPSVRRAAQVDKALLLSSPERAVLEAIKELPDVESFHTLDVIFEGLVNLRPRRITALLLDCTSVQVKRLFFVYADRHDHAWRKHIDADTVNLGSGDRSFVKGGKLHPRYRITIPDNLMPAADGDAA